MSAIVTDDEKDKAIRAKVAQIVVETLERREREGKDKGHDVRESPNFQRWQKALSANPFAAQANGIALPSSRMDVGAIVRGFTGSDQFKNFTSQMQEKSSSWDVPPGLYFGSNEKTAGVTGTSDARTVLATDYQSGIILKPHELVRVRDLSPVETTDIGALKYMRESGYTNNMTMMPENFNPGSSTAASQSAVAVEMASADVKTITTILPVPEEFLQDLAGFQQYVETRLEQMAMDTEDSQLLSGDGTGNNMTGHYIDSGIQTLNWSAGDLGDNMADAILNAIVLAWMVHHAPDGFVLHPSRWAKIVKLKDGNQNYLIPTVHQSSQPVSLWGLPGVLTTANPSTKCLVAPFAMCTKIYDRQKPTIYITRDYSDYRSRNIVAFFLNARLAVVRSLPDGLVALTFDAAPSA